MIYKNKKHHTLFLIPFFLLNILGCNEPQKETNSSPNSSDTTIQIIPKGEVEIEKNNSEPESYFISAKSGLNYRTTPNGKILGKFLLNDKVNVVKHTNVFEEIKDGNEVVKGEWVGVQKDKDTVYVFDAFLSSTKIELPLENIESEEIKRKFYSELAIFSLNEYETGKGEPILFVSFSDVHSLSKHSDSLAISEKYLGIKNFDNYHKLNQKYRTRFLNNIGVEESDNLYIYNYSLDTILTYQVNDLPVIAVLSPYTQSDQQISQYDYMIGFDIGKKSPLIDYQFANNSFVYVGIENPFVSNNIEPIIWEKTDHQSFPSVNLSAEVSKNLKTFQLKETYKFTANNLKYFIQIYNHKKYGSRSMHLVVQSDDSQIVLNEVLFEGESASFAPLSIVGTEGTPEQWTGSIFKNVPPVLFGFVYESFGCSGIYVTGEPSGYIGIYCDNRH